MSDYYDKDGSPITVKEWGRLWTEDYKRIARDVLPNGRVVSTVWLGLDHGFYNSSPLIFETMVFSDSGEDLDQARYTTEAHARFGHSRMVAKWSVETPEDDEP